MIGRSHIGPHSERVYLPVSQVFNLVHYPLNNCESEPPFLSLTDPCLQIELFVVWPFKRLTAIRHFDFDPVLSSLKANVYVSALTAIGVTDNIAARFICSKEQCLCHSRLQSSPGGQILHECPDPDQLRFISRDS
jgi:hypothetical protein